MLIEELMQVIPPPTNPRNTGDFGKWSRLQLKLKALLPDEYYTVCATYGSGTFRVGSLELSILNLFDPRHLKGAKNCAEITRQNRDSGFTFGIPFRIYPEPEGIFPWAEDCDGGTFWIVPQVNVHPDSWQILAFDREASRLYIYSLSMIQFLVKLFSSELQRGGIWGGQSLEGEKKFIKK